MRANLAAFASALLLALPGCQTMSADRDVPAVIDGADENSRAALRTTMSGLFGGQDVLLAEDALTQSSLLLIEQGARGSLRQLPAGGRVLGRPLRFRLVRSGDDCVLIDPRDDSRHRLADTRCKPE